MNFKFLWRKNDVLTPTEAASRRKVYTFLICLICSSLFWLFTKLSQDNQADYTRMVGFAGSPEGQLGVSQSDSLVTFTLESAGIRLIWARFFMPRELLRFRTEDLPVIRQNGKSLAYITSGDIATRIEESMEGRARVSLVRPDTVFLEMAPSADKLLPVVLRADISFGNRYEQYGEINIEPDSINVTGPAVVLDTLRALYTEHWEVQNLRRTTDRQLRVLPPPNIQSFEMEENQVRVRVPVEEFTEASIQLPIEVVCPEGVEEQDLRLFPGHVTVNYMVSFRDFRTISEGMFRAVVNCPGTDNDGRLRVYLESHPSFVRIISHRPEYVEYIIME